MTLIDDLLKRQEQLPDEDGEPPLHQPEMLLIGCVDARKDPIRDLGIPKGKALILRNIAALIRGTKVDPELRATEAAALEFAVKVMKVKHIAVMGHTDCGGIRAALDDLHLPDIRYYLSPLNEVRDDVQSRGGSKEEQARTLEREAVRMSIDNLRSYDYIAQAEAEGRLSLHGWVLNIGRGKIEVVG